MRIERVTLTIKDPDQNAKFSQYIFKGANVKTPQLELADATLEEDPNIKAR